jgi:Putative polyhydroxyalkanoic acid system protein (PHA_gran_rgn)
MRISISHKKPKEEVIETIDRSVKDALQQSGSLPVKLVDLQTSWQGSTMNFSLTAKMGFMSSPIKGTVEVTDQDVIIIADLGIFERFIPESKAKEMLTTRFHGLLR